MLERRPVNASLKLHVTARPANYSRAREWEKFLSLSPWALDVYKRGSRYAGVLYNVQTNFHCNTRFCYANRDACREGASCTMFGIPVFLNWIEKDGQCWQASSWSNAVSISTLSSMIWFVVIIVVPWICLLDIL